MFFNSEFTDDPQAGNDASADASVRSAALVNPSKILSGGVREYVVTHPGQSQYTQAGGGVSACGLAALNCARLVLGFHATGLGSEQLVQELMSRRLLEDILKPCLTWESRAHLAVEDIYKAPVFKQTLTQLSSNFGQSNYGFFKKLITDISNVTKERGVSACIIITRPPEIIACFSIADVPTGTELFVIFDSHPRPEKHPHGAAFIFYNSIRGAARYLTELLHFDESILRDADVQWQAQLLAHCSGDIFVASETPPNSTQWAETALDASLQVLSSQAQVRELQTRVGELEGETKRLREELVGLEHDLINMDDLWQKEQEKNERLRRKYGQAPRRSAYEPPPLFDQEGFQSPRNEYGFWRQVSSAMPWPLGSGASSSASSYAAKVKGDAGTRRDGAAHRDRDDSQRNAAAQRGEADDQRGQADGQRGNANRRRARETPRERMRREDEEKRNAAAATSTAAAPPPPPPPPAPPVPDVDPLAVQLQIYFDEEDQQLAQQLRDLQAAQPELFDCGICFEQFEEDYIARVHPCGHAYCRGCLADYARSKIDEHRYPILCPHCSADRTRLEAPGELDDDAVQKLGLTEEQYEVFVEMQMNKFSTMIHCRKCQQSLFVDKAEYQENNIINCPLHGCGYVWCKLCSQEVDLSVPEHTCDGTKELDHLMQQRGWKHCPGCKTPAEKIDGCNHITCGSPGCNSHFCYHCGELIVRSALPREINAAKSNHYTRCKLF